MVKIILDVFQATIGDFQSSNYNIIELLHQWVQQKTIDHFDIVQLISVMGNQNLYSLLPDDAKKISLLRKGSYAECSGFVGILLGYYLRR